MMTAIDRWSKMFANWNTFLRRAGLRDDRLLVKIDEGATHNEREWAKRFPEALEFLFGPVTS